VLSSARPGFFVTVVPKKRELLKNLTPATGASGPHVYNLALGDTGLRKERAYFYRSFLKYPCVAGFPEPKAAGPGPEGVSRIYGIRFTGPVPTPPKCEKPLQMLVFAVPKIRYFGHSSRELFAMAQTDDYDSHDDPGWFRDQLRQRDRLIADLRREQDEVTAYPPFRRVRRGLQRHARTLSRDLRHGNG
jgi:hypothetical protein